MPNTGNRFGQNVKINGKILFISESKANYVLESTWCKLNDTEQGIQNVYIKVSKH